MPRDTRGARRIAGWFRDACRQRDRIRVHFGEPPDRHRPRFHAVAAGNFAPLTAVVSTQASRLSLGVGCVRSRITLATRQEAPMKAKVKKPQKLKMSAGDKPGGFKPGGGKPGGGKKE